MPRITHISITAHEIINTGDYGSTRPSVTLGAELLPGEDAGQVMHDLFDLATEQLHARADAELMAAGREPRYYDGPLYHVRYNSEAELVIVAPKAWKGADHRWHRDSYKALPLEQARHYADEVLGERDNEHGRWEIRVCESLDAVRDLADEIHRRIEATKQRRAAEEQAKREAEFERERQRLAAEAAAKAPPAEPVDERQTALVDDIAPF